MAVRLPSLVLSLALAVAPAPAATATTTLALGLVVLGRLDGFRLFSHLDLVFLGFRNTLMAPMILSRTGNDSLAYGSVMSTGAIAAVLGTACTTPGLITHNFMTIASECRQWNTTLPTRAE